ncbi:MAG: ABC transporter ATP-binding protein [Candidatus Woesearchaeota archaeon]
MADPIFKLVNVKKSYGKRVILDNINFEVRRGEILGLIGPSGSGKTTMLNIIIGFIKPEEGDVLFRLEHVLKYQTAITFRSVFRKFGIVKHIYGFASQMPSFYPNLSVEENLSYFASLYSLSKDTVKSNIETLLKFLDLEEARKVKARKLSGGMERRLDIACALIHDPDVLILDEPTADLDPLLTNHLLELIKKINKKGTTIIIASHNLNEIEHLCHRVAILKDKELFAIATPEEIKERYTSKQHIYLESYPGNYDEIIRRLRTEDHVACEKKGSELVITTTKSHLILHKLFHYLEQLKENVIDLRVYKASLHDIFIELTEEKTPASKKEEEAQEKPEEDRALVKDSKKEKEHAKKDERHKGKEKKK